MPDNQPTSKRRWPRRIAFMSIAMLIVTPVLIAGLSAFQHYQTQRLIVACYQNDRDLAESALYWGASVDGTAWGERRPPLVIAVDYYAERKQLSGGLSPLMALLLEHGVDIHAEDPRGRSALSAACTLPDLKLIEELIAHGADVNQGNYTTKPLLVAIQHRPHFPRDLFASNDIIELLLAQGADPNVHGIVGPAIVWVASQPHAFAALTLLKHGADIETEGQNYTPLTSAIGHGQEEVARVLIGAGADVNHGIDQGYRIITPLYVAIRWGGLSDAAQERTIRRLLLAGADLDLNSPDQDMPFRDHPVIKKVIADLTADGKWPLEPIREPPLP